MTPILLKVSIFLLISDFGEALLSHKFFKHHDKCEACEETVRKLPSYRIVHGHQTHILRYPYMVSIQQRRLLARAYCGGTVLNHWWVLTAAHCVTDKSNGEIFFPNRLVALAGLTSCRNIGYFSRVIDLKAIYRHPLYHRGLLYNDIAMLRLKTPVVIGEIIKPVFLATARILRGEDPYYYFKSCEALGWGAVGFKQRFSDLLRVARLPILRQQTCSRWIQYGSYLRPTQMCTYDFRAQANTRKDACQGDSGGPLMCDGMQIGITSWGTNCAAYQCPGIWTRVDKYEQWINAVQKQEKYFIYGHV